MASEKESEERQRPPNTKVSDDDLLRAIATTEEPVAKTSEVAEVLPVQQQTVKHRLDALEDDGYVESKDVGRGKVWWLSSERADLGVTTAKTEELERRMSIVEDRLDELEGDEGGWF